MSEFVRSRDLNAERVAILPPASSTTGAGIGLDRILEGTWSLLTSMRFGLVLILAIAGLALVGTLVIQAPPGVEGDATAKADWLAEIRPRYGSWTGLLDRLQMFGVFTSVWFRVLVAFLAASLIACSSQRLPRLWRTATKPHITVGDRFFESAPQRERIVAAGDAADATAHLVEALRHRHYRVLQEDGSTVHLYADRFRWAPMGTVVTHLSLVVILAGAMVGSMLGFRDGNFMIPEGSTVPVADSAGLEARLISFDNSYYTDTGAPADYASDVALYEGGVEVARQTVRVNEPLRYGGLSFYQSFYGPAAIVRVADVGGRPLFGDGVPLGWTATDLGRRVGTFTARDADLTVWVVGTSGSADPLVKPGQMRVELYRASDGQAIGAQTLDQGVATEVAGFTFLFERELQFSGLSIVRDPGTPLIWAGALLLVLGTVLVLMFPHRRIWARVSVGPGGRTAIAVAGAGKRDIAANTEFTDLIADIRAALATPARA